MGATTGKRGSVKRRLFHFLEDCFMRFFRMLNIIFPVAWVAPTGRMIGALITALLPGYKKMILDRLRGAFPEKSEQEIRRLFHRTVRNGGEAMYEQLMVSQKMITEELARTRGFDVFIPRAKEIYRRAGTALVVGSHMNNWEKLMGLGAHWLQEVLDIDTYVVMRRMPTPYVDSLVTVLRNQILKCQFIYTKRSRYFINQILDRKTGIIVFATDIDYRYKGLFVPFMGQKISMGRGPAHYAITRDVPLCFIMCFRDEEGHLNVHIEEIERGESTGDTEQDIYNLTANLAARIEYWIRRYPEQWFGWMMNPWTTRPIEELEAALEKDPEDHRVMEQMGQFFLAKDQREEAKEIFRRILKVKEDNLSAHSELGRLLLDEGAFEEGIFHLFRALEINPRNAKSLNYMGQMLLKRGLHKLALGYFRRAHKSWYDNGEASWGIGQCLDRLGKRKKAMAVYHKALRINDDYAPIHIALAQIYLSQPDKKEELQKHLTTLKYLQTELPPELAQVAA